MFKVAMSQIEPPVASDLADSSDFQDLWEFQRQAVARATMSSMPRGAAAAGSSRLLRKKGGDGGVLVVCPATVLHQWAKEFHLWYPPLRVCVFHQKASSEPKTTGCVQI
ncbi:SWI2/SNF2 containing protein RAD26 [Toxoplasma gondii TgCatPRC2]|uniref:SWI2/SNF2 containing protein RAD26 n=1 Tax=Toxoplasma gondii TgCatPRC2 TaxID=1130821 RepID=A0A151HMP1_TOXGO|nr:SWI2/SNF2 containing protein RAD26 [Toxoplasma gondii TgCatPRC2]